MLITAGAVILGRLGDAGGLLSFLYQFLVVRPIIFGAAYAWLRAARGSKPEVNDLFLPFRRNYLGTVIAGLLWQLAIGIGLVLFIIPGLILAVRLAFVPFLVVDEGLGALEALSESWRRTSGYSWTIVGAWLVGIVAVFVGLLLLVIGSIPATMLVYLAFASLYAAATARQRAGHPYNQPHRPAVPVSYSSALGNSALATSQRAPKLLGPEKPLAIDDPDADLGEPGREDVVAMSRRIHPSRDHRFRASGSRRRCSRRRPASRYSPPGRYGRRS